MNSQLQAKKQRQYFIDWLRIGLIISVFFYHVGMIFRPELWHINSAKSFPFLEPIMWWLALWRMPLLFLVSGIGTYYALGFRTTKQYIKERFTRLYIPFTVGFFTLVPLMVYIERIDQYGSLLNYIPHMFDGGGYPNGNISWHHLWFLLYLLIISLFISPFIKYSRSENFKRFKESLVKICSKNLGLNIVLPLLIVVQLVLREYYPNHTHALVNDLAYLTYYLLFFLCGFVLFTSKTLINSIARQRRLYLLQTIVFSVLFYSVHSIFSDPTTVKFVYRAVAIVLTWSCGIAVVGYTRIYFNNDHKYRRVLNEAIYPFYLLHQPAIIVVGYYVLQWNVSYGVKAISIILISLVIVIVSYLIIKRYNILRIAFGLKKLKIERKEDSKIESYPAQSVLKLIEVKDTNSN